MYIPPSQYRTGYFSNNNYNLSTNNQPYTGPYWVLNSNNRPFSGNSPSSNSILLILPLDKTPTPSYAEGKEGLDPDDNSTITINSKHSKAISRLKLSPFTPTITDSQIITITRYFAKENNSYKYLEINSRSYSKVLSRNQRIAWDLYDVTSLPWLINGDSTYVQKQNKATILNIEDISSGHNPIGKNWAGFSQMFNNYLQFYQGIQENLNTSGGEYQTPDGKEYIGPYHIHPTKGPMVGANHVSDPHDYLYPINLPISEITTPTPITPTTTPTQQPTTPTYTPPPTTGGGIFSGGGGGGY